MAVRNSILSQLLRTFQRLYKKEELMRHHILAIIALAVTTFCHAQTFDWLTTAGGITSDKGTKIVVDAAGNIFETGYYNEQGFFGPFDTGFSNPSSKEAYVAKMDPDGNYLWVKNGINYFDDRGLGLCLDPQGNVYITGTCWGGLVWGTLNVYNVSSYTDQIFVLKLDTDGNEIWMKNAGVNEAGYPYNDDHGHDLASDSQGNIYVTGFLSNNDATNYDATFDAITVPVAAYDSIAFIAKLTNDGVWQWVKTFDGIYSDRDNGMTVDDEDNVYVTGGFIETADFGTTTLTSAGEEDIYVVKYDGAGNFLWVTQAGSVRGDRGNDIIQGSDGNMYITGEFRDSCNFGTVTDLDNFGNPSGRDIFVAKITKNGNWVWAKKGGSKKGSDKGLGITANNQGNIFITGQFSANADFGSHGIDSAGDSVNVFVAGIDTLGVWRWVIQGGGTDFDRGSGIAVDQNCNIYVTGYYTDNISFSGLIGNVVSGKEIFTIKVIDGCFDYTIPPPPPPPGPVPVGYSGFHLPNAFSPNNDDNNEFLQYYVGYDVASFDLQIYDRWGNLMFRTQTNGEFWDGRYKGELVNTGIYTYVLNVTLLDLGPSSKTGNITVIR